MHPHYMMRFKPRCNNHATVKFTRHVLRISSQLLPDQHTLATGARSIRSRSHAIHLAMSRFRHDLPTHSSCLTMTSDAALSRIVTLGHIPPCIDDRPKSSSLRTPARVRIVLLQTESGKPATTENSESRGDSVSDSKLMDNAALLDLAPASRYSMPTCGSMENVCRSHSGDP